MKRKILLQCQSITYLYFGLGAVYTKYPDDDIEIDVMLTNNDVLIERFMKKIKLSKYVSNIFPYNYRLLGKINKRLRKYPKNFLTVFLYKYFFKPRIIKIIKNITKCSSYTDIAYSQETQENLITYLKMAYPDAHFITFGDGPGGIAGADSYAEKHFPYKFFNQIKPDEIIAIAPSTEDSSIDVSDIPILGVNKDIQLKIISEDEKIQAEINKFTDDILNNYPQYKEKTMLLTSQLEDEKYRMTEQDKINIYLDIIEKYCSGNTLVILKLHPVTRQNVIAAIKEKSPKNCGFVLIPDTLKEYPAEIYYKLMQNLDYAVTFLSSSSISLSFLYGIKTIDAYEIVQNYPVKDRINIVLESYREIIKRLKDWDGKSLVYSYNTEETVNKFEAEHKKISAEIKQVKKLTLLQKVFSVTNIYSDYGSRKQLCILGIKVKF